MKRFDPLLVIGGALLAASITLSYLCSAVRLSAQAPLPIVVGTDGRIQAADYGVKPGVDCTAALQRLCGVEFPKGATIQLPAGGILLTARVDARTGIKNNLHDDHLWIRGANGGTTITGNFAGPLLAYNAEGKDASASVQVEGITFQNSHPDGIGLQIERTDRCYVHNCEFSNSHRGLVIGSLQFTNVEVVISQCSFVGNVPQFPGGIGAAVRMQGTFRDNKFTGWGDAAVKAAGAVRFEGRTRIEQCNKGIDAGRYLNGTAQTRITLEQVVCEATTSAIVIEKPVVSAILNNCQLHGTGPVNGLPMIGLDCQEASGRVTITNLTTSAPNWREAAVKLAGDGPVVLINSRAGTPKPPGVPWLVTMDQAKLTKIQSNVP